MERPVEKKVLIMNIWYLSENRFTNRIVKRWQQNGTKFNSGNVNILKYAFRSVQYWSNVHHLKTSKANKVETNPTLF